MIRKPIYYNRRKGIVRTMGRVVHDLMQYGNRVIYSFNSNAHTPSTPVSPVDPTATACSCCCAWQTLVTVGTGKAGANLETAVNLNDTLVTASENPSCEFNWGLAYRIPRIVMTADPQGFGVPETPLIFDIGSLNRVFSFEHDGANWIPIENLAFAMPVVDDSDYIPDPLRLRLWQLIPDSGVDMGFVMDTVSWDEGITVKLAQWIIPGLEGVTGS